MKELETLLSGWVSIRQAVKIRFHLQWCGEGGLISTICTVPFPQLRWMRKGAQ